MPYKAGVILSQIPYFSELIASQVPGDCPGGMDGFGIDWYITIGVANSHVDSVTPFRSMILSCQRSPYFINIQLRRRVVGYFIGILALSVVRDGELY